MILVQKTELRRIKKTIKQNLVFAIQRKSLSVRKTEDEPGYLSGINITGLHFHFLSEDCTAGGN